MTLSVGSLFSGIGGFDEAFRRAGARTEWLVEIDPACQKVLARHFPGVPIHSDVREVGAHNLAPVDVIVYGSPCQDLSVAGKRAGLEGARSGLFYEATRIIRELRPTFALWENVQGALSSSDGRDFGAVLDELADAGALDLGWSVMDAQWFGLAQRRRRVFLVADFGGERAAEILSIPYGGPWDSPPSREAGARVAAGADSCADLTGTLTSNGDQHKGFRNGEGLVTGAVTSKWAKGTGGPSGDECQNLIAAPISFAWQSGGDVRLDVREEHVGTLHREQTPAVAYQCHGSNVGPMGTLRAGNGNEAGGVPFVAAVSVNQRREGRLRDVHGSLNGHTSATQFDGVMTGLAVRRLTPRECERLQGFPDDWTAGQADSTRYRQLGNSVAVPCVEWIAKRIVEALNG